MFYFSNVNNSMIHGNGLDLLAGQLTEHAQAQMYMHQVPMFNFSNSTTPPDLFNTFCLDPMTVAQQTLNNFPMPGMERTNLFQVPGNNIFGNNGGSSDSSSSTNTEYKTLRKVLENYRKLVKDGTIATSSTLDEVNKALRKSGKAEERLQALKDAYKLIDKNDLEKAVLELKHKELINAGYEIHTKKDEFKNLKKHLNSIEQEIQNKSPDTSSLITLVPSESTENILQIISTWNNEHNTDENRGIIRLMAKNLPTKEGEQANWITCVQRLTMSLINKVEDVKVNDSKDYSDLDDAKKDLSKELTKVLKDKKLSKSELIKLADKFDILYAKLRIESAENIRNDIHKSNGILNNVANDDKDIVTNGLVVNKTKEDLENEGITNIPSASPIPGEQDSNVHEDENNEDENNDNDDGKVNGSRKPEKEEKEEEEEEEEEDVENDIPKYSKSELAEISEQKAEAEEDNPSALEYGEKVSNNLQGYTTDNEWRQVKNKILNDIDSENIYSFIKGFTDDDTWVGSDNILEQIGTEYGRSASEKIELINTIIKNVIKHCIDHGNHCKSSFKTLYNKYRNGIDTTTVKDKVSDTDCEKLREIDHLILDVFEIDNY